MTWIRRNKNNLFTDAIISNVKDSDHVIYCHPQFGPCFGRGLFMKASNNYDPNIDKTYCRKEDICYVKRIREKEEFLMEDYEVFQVIRR